ncbi:Tight junction-associated protein 1 [Frankliniella fusca]|uniref:Tight junction-associated protein 1 n=1 Tax=Frankliniella fusca TaxID=407009 RepID=A0AAE1HE76_9NEOP|nr:Tight junction-associated protein 1 [Frankliniella fusca]
MGPWKVLNVVIKRVQKVNQGLEDKLLRVVDKFESGKAALTRDVASLTQRLVDAHFNVSRFQEENKRYRNDWNVAIQFLQCRPSNFVSQKFEQLPTELQHKVRTPMASKRCPSESSCPPAKVERKTIKVPIPRFPLTAMVYSVNKAPSEKDMSDEEREIGEGNPPVDIVSAAILAKILEERERVRHLKKHFSTGSCSSLLKVDANTQIVTYLSATPQTALL